MEERELVQQIYHENKGRYGYRRITLEFRNRGWTTNHKVIHKLMHEEQIVCKVRQYRYNSYKEQIGKVAPNLLERDFSTTGPNEKWVTDVTQFNLFGTKLYLSPILDLHNQSLVSWNLSECPNYAQTVDMLEKAFVKIPDGTNLILHSDQGWQYQMYDYQRRLKEKGIRQSMSRKGSCLDNSVMENFFGLLKSELLYVVMLFFSAICFTSLTVWGLTCRLEQICLRDMPLSISSRMSFGLILAISRPP